MVKLIDLYNEIKINNPTNNEALLKFMNANKEEIIKKLDWRLRDDMNNKLDEFVDPKNLQFELYDVEIEDLETEEEVNDKGVTIKEPKNWNDLPHYGKSFKWLKDADKNTFYGEEGEEFEILDIKGKKIAYISYNI